MYENANTRLNRISDDDRDSIEFARSRLKRTGLSLTVLNGCSTSVNYTTAYKYYKNQEYNMICRRVNSRVTITLTAQRRGEFKVKESNEKRELAD
jgi:hypothetical protein